MIAQVTFPRDTKNNGHGSPPPHPRRLVRLHHHHPHPYGRLTRVTTPSPTSPTSANERPPGPRVRIVHLSGPVFRALAEGDLATASAVSPVPLSEYFIGPDWVGVWKIRRDQAEEDPESPAWVTGVIWDEDRQLAVGRAGFHGPPDEAGMVEVGYAVDPEYRRRGYARAGLEALLERAAREPGVRSVRASISPDNTPSLNLVSQYGFVQVGEQWDEEDGLEIIYEVPANEHPTP